MTVRCPRTEDVTRALVGGEPLPATLREHVTACAACARTAAAYRRFEQELGEAAAARVVEPLPRSALEAPAPQPRHGRWWPLAARIGAAAAGIGAVALVAAVLSGPHAPPAGQATPLPYTTASYGPLASLTANGLRASLEALGLTCAPSDIELQKTMSPPPTAPGVRCTADGSGVKRSVTFLSWGSAGAAHLIAVIDSPEKGLLDAGQAAAFLDQVAALTVTRDTAEQRALQAWISAVTAGENGNCTCGPLSAAGHAYRLQAEVGTAFALWVDAGGQ